MLFSEQNDSEAESNKAATSIHLKNDGLDYYSSEKSFKYPNSYSLFKRQSDILPLNNLACNDLLHKKLNNSEPINNSYSLFNKNFTTFMKYSDTKNILDINMAMSSNKLVEDGLNEMLAATSLKTDNNKFKIEPVSEPIHMKRQTSSVQSNLCHLVKASTSTSNDLKGMSSPKLITTSSSCSSSNSSSSSSSRTGSNETPKVSTTKQELSFSPLCKPKNIAISFKQQKNDASYSKDLTCSSSSFSSLSSSSSSTSSSTLKSSSPPLFNIENELIKYTKNLKTNNRLYLDSYKLGSHIRNGGFSEIYEGTNLTNQADKVIIKLIPKRKTKNWLMVHNKKYPAEILLHKMCNTVDGVVKMIEFFEQENDWIIIMPKLSNCVDLFDYLESKQRGRLTECEACHFFVQLVKINIDLLSQGVVHRDIKSENILVDLNTMKLILIDFGASAICRNSKTSNTGQHFYTDFHGTRQYKPPEYITFKKYTASSSTIWTLGILLFDMCNGQLPFETEQEILDYNLQIKAPVSEDYKILLHDCLRLDPLMRPNLEKILEYSWCVNNLKEYQRLHSKLDDSNSNFASPQ